MCAVMKDMGSGESIDEASVVFDISSAVISTLEGDES